MTKFYKANDAYFVFNSQQNNVVDRLPVGNYVIKRHPMTGEFYFSQYDKDVSVPSKIYGNVEGRARRILSTYLDRDGSTGVLFSGEKGSGKTMLCKLTCQIAATEHDIPTIFVSEPFTSQDFMELLGNLTQPVIVLFDEFEKTYDGEQSEQYGQHDQKAILTLLDGVFTSKILYLFTCNDRFSIDDHMINRPGRIFYAFEYQGLEEDFVKEYCRDNLHGEFGKTDEVIRVVKLFRHFNFDMLKALVEEMNRYNESARDSLEYLNINPERDMNEYVPRLFLPDGFEVKTVNPSKVKNPLSWTGHFDVYTYELSSAYSKKRKGSAPTPTTANVVTLDDDEDDEVNGYTGFKFSKTDIRVSESGVFELINSYGERLLLSKAEYNFDWRAL